MKGLLTGRRSVWQARYVGMLAAGDLLVLSSVALLAPALRFGEINPHTALPYPLLAALMSLLWIGMLAVVRCYETREVLTAGDEHLRAVRASAAAFACVAFTSYLLGAELSRLFTATYFSLGLLGLVTVRVVVHRALRLARVEGRANHRLLLLGDEASCRWLLGAFVDPLEHGHTAVAACLTSGPAEPDFPLPSVVGLEELAAALHEYEIDTVAVASGAEMGAEVVRAVSYAVEGTGIDLLVAPSLLEVSGSRVNVRPVAGLPLLHIDEPELGGTHRVVKEVFDRVSAALLLLLVLPTLIVLAVIVRTTSSGPALFKQERVGRDGKRFLVWKFRSMREDAEALFEELKEHNEHDGPHFKMRDDPRVTPIGRFLRKYSLDELPQLVNVLRGDMSLVGPRPPLPAEVANYDGYAHRRLLVKPGLTGLWQVSGRADLDWEDAVRLDVAYVDSWSLGFDLSLLFRTLGAVVRGSGAY